MPAKQRLQAIQQQQQQRRRQQEQTVLLEAPAAAQQQAARAAVSRPSGRASPKCCVICVLGHYWANLYSLAGQLKFCIGSDGVQSFIAQFHSLWQHRSMQN